MLVVIISLESKKKYAKKRLAQKKREMEYKIQSKYSN